jgi:acylphosphatase
MTEEHAAVRVHIMVSGTVQKVGFRVFAQNLALEHALAGYVRNHHEAVEIEAQGPNPSINQFVDNLKYKAPHSAKVQSVDVHYIDPLCDEGNNFRILSTIRGTIRND